MTDYPRMGVVRVTFTISVRVVEKEQECQESREFCGLKFEGPIAWVGLLGRAASPYPPVKDSGGVLKALPAVSGVEPRPLNDFPLF